MAYFRILMQKDVKFFGKEKKGLATIDSFTFENWTLTLDTIGVGQLSTNHYFPSPQITFMYVYAIQFSNCSNWIWTIILGWKTQATYLAHPQERRLNILNWTDLRGNMLPYSFWVDNVNSCRTVPGSSELFRFS
jgi:hypothetical protein